MYVVVRPRQDASPTLIPNIPERGAIPRILSLNSSLSDIDGSRFPAR